MKPIFNTEKWLALVVSLPATNSALRMRIWRGLKGIGCAVLRDGVYLLPAGRGLRQALRMHAEEIKRGGGSAYLLNVANPSTEEKTDFQGLFDRSGEYRDLVRRISAFQAGFAALDADAARRQLKLLRRGLESLRAVDYFPGAGKANAEDALIEAEAVFFARMRSGGLDVVPGAVMPRNREEFRNRIWATRRHLWVDRMASSWLIRRFIDSEASFLWLEKPEDCPEQAVSFDFNGADFAHVGNQVTFEVLLAAFGLESDPGLKKLGGLVHYLDVGGTQTAEAAGVEKVLAGACRDCSDDDVLLAEATRTFDFLYVAFADEGGS